MEGGRKGEVILMKKYFSRKVNKNHEIITKRDDIKVRYYSLRIQYNIVFFCRMALYTLLNSVI